MAVLWTLVNIYIFLTISMGSKKQYLWSKINKCEGNCCVLWIHILTDGCSSKIGMILENIVFHKFNLLQVIFNKKWAPKLLFFGTFWRTVSHRIHKVQWFPLNIKISYLRYFSKVFLCMRKFAKEYLKPQSGQVKLRLNFQLSSLLTRRTKLIVAC